MNTATLDRPLAFESDEESLYVLIARLLGLRAVHSEVDLHRAIGEGSDHRHGAQPAGSSQSYRCRDLPAHRAAADFEPTRSLRATAVF